MLTVRLLASPTRRIAWNLSMTRALMAERTNIARTRFDAVQTFSVEFNRSLHVRSRLLGLEIVVTCTERLDRMTLQGRCLKAIAARTLDFVLAIAAIATDHRRRGGLTQFLSTSSALSKSLNFKRDRVDAGKGRRRVR